MKAKPNNKQQHRKGELEASDLKALRKAIKRKDKVTLVRTIKPTARGR